MSSQLSGRLLAVDVADGSSVRTPLHETSCFTPDVYDKVSVMTKRRSPMPHILFRVDVSLEWREGGWNLQ